MFITMKKRIILFTLLIFSSFAVFAEPPAPPMSLPPPPAKGPRMNHRNFHGKRMIDEEIDFKMIFVKATNTPNNIFFELIFTQPVNPQSVTEENFLINGKTLPIKMIRFSKNYRSVHCFIDQEAFLTQVTRGQTSNDTQGQTFDLEIKNIESIKGDTIEPVEFKSFHTDEEYRYLRREALWKKF